MDSERGTAASGTSLESLACGQFSGREAFKQRVSDALACAAQEGWHEIILSDATFEDWPLHERSLLESLHAWSRSGRRLMMLATRYDEVTKRYDRFVAWRKTWGHIIDCRVCRVVSADFPSAIWSPTWFMHRVDPLQSRGVCGYDRVRSVQLKEVLNEKMRDSSPGFPSSVLGL